jgi:tRNA threonylcarbamoyladenosine biosynthesis protein TsaB
MNLLAIDTISEMASIALSTGDDLLVDEDYVPQEHTKVILPMIQRQMATAGLSFPQLDAIAFSRGPGSFTGLRICASITQGLALAHDLPVIPVSSLAILAQGSYRLEKKPAVVTCLDARRHEVYWACYKRDDSDVMRLVGSEQVIAPGLASTGEGESWHGVGTGFKTYQAELAENSQVHLASVEPERFPLARDAISHAKNAWLNKEVVDASLAIPIYLRDNIATPRKANP